MIIAMKDAFWSDLDRSIESKVIDYQYFYNYLEVVDDIKALSLIKT